MKITALHVGKTENKSLEGLIQEYMPRINRYINFWHDFVMVPKNTGKLKPTDVKKTEGELILKKLESADYVILLDEHGKHYTSSAFAGHMQQLMNIGYKNIFFVTGGAYGFSDEVKKRGNELISFSSFTTTHQLIRLFFTEQLYRAFTILNNHPYHNE
jgi:23S rRNA (pseudouridine1915-N3)-methyltransferase